MSSAQEPRSGDERRLTQGARALLTADAATRRAYIERDRWFVHYAAKRTLARLEYEFARQRAQRQPGVLIFGDPNAGKSAIVKTFLRRHPNEARPSEENDRIDISSFEIDSARDSDFFDAALPTLNSDIKLRTVSDKKDHLYTLLRRHKPRMMFVDEVHAMLSGSVKQRERLWSIIKKLSNVFRITVVLVGCDVAKHALLRDAQLRSRFRFLEELPKWKDTPEYRKFLFVFEADYPLLRESRIWEDSEMAEYLRNRNEGILGDMIVHLQDTATLVLGDGERITLSALKKVR